MAAFDSFVNLAVQVLYQLMCTSARLRTNVFERRSSSTEPGLFE